MMKDRAFRGLTWGATSISFTLDKDLPEASLTFTYWKANHSSERRVETNRSLKDHEALKRGQQRPAAALLHVVTVPFAFFELLVDLGND